MFWVRARSSSSYFQKIIREDWPSESLSTQVISFSPTSVPVHIISNQLHLSLINFYCHIRMVAFTRDAEFIPQLYSIHIYQSGIAKTKQKKKQWPVFWQNEELLNRYKPLICACFNMQTPPLASRLSCRTARSKVRWRNLSFGPICFVFIHPSHGAPHPKDWTSFQVMTFWHLFLT